MKSAFRIALDRGNGYAELVEQYPTLTDFRPAWLGDLHRQVTANRQDLYYVRRVDGVLLVVVNDLGVPPIPDLPVIVGQSQDGAWHIVRAKRYQNAETS
jgi:hypothetical protein